MVIRKYISTVFILLWYILLILSLLCVINVPLDSCMASEESNSNLLFHLIKLYSSSH